jgi:hypothetical protein
LPTGSAPTFDYVEKLVAIGLALDKVARTLTQMTDHHVASVQELVDLYRDEVWRPFTDAGLPTDKVATEEAAKLASATPPPKAGC